MATQLATTDQEQRAPSRVPVATGGKLAAFVPQTMEEAWRLSTALAASNMTPKAYGNDPNKIMVGIMAGAEVGLTPFAALQSIAVIGNNPSLWGDGALALVQSSGLLEDMEETDDGQMATCRLNRAGRSTPIVRSFSMEDAKKAGLAGKSGPWTQYPARMRQMRARAFAMRDGFSDVLKGLHIAEEMRDYTPMGGGSFEGQSQPLTGAMLIEQSKPTLAEELNDSIPALDPESNDGTLAADNPTASEGPDDSQRGEASSGADDADDTPMWKQVADNFTAELRAATTAKAVKTLEDKWVATIRAGIPDDAAVEWIEKAIAARKRDVAPKKDS